MPDTEHHNRIASALNTKWKRFAFFCSFVATCVLLLEIAALGLTAVFTHFSGRSMELVGAQFLLARPFFENPVTAFTDAEYVGHLPTPAALRRWNEADPILGWRNGKNIGTTSTHGYGEGVEWRTTNAQGFFSAGDLDFVVPLQKLPGIFRIFILGGSTVAGYGVKSPLENLPARFRTTLNERLRATRFAETIEVINAGVDGYFSINEYLYFSTELADYDPDLIIFYGGWNDYLFWDQAPVFSKRSSQHRKLYELLNASYTVSGSARHFARSLGAPFIDLSFQLASLWIPKRLIEKFFIDQSLALSDDGFDVNNNVVQTPRNQIATKSIKARELYATNIRDAIVFARQRDIKVAYFLQPILGVSQKRVSGYEEEWLRFNPADVAKRQDFYDDMRGRLRVIEAEYRDSPDVCVKDLSAATDAESARVFTDSGHLNEKGNSMLAASMIDALFGCSIFH